MSLLSTLFGPSKDEIWAQIALDIGGKFNEDESLKQSNISYQHGNWEIVLDTFYNTKGTYTRMRAPFINKDGLYFKIYNEGFYDGISKYFGMQDINIGDTFFDEDFIIKGNDEYQIRRLLKDNKLKTLIGRHSNVHFSIRENQGFFNKQYQEEVDELYFENLGPIENTYQLKDLFELFSLTLERLVKIDSAYPNDPTLKFVE